MIVSELIELLKQQPPDRLVVVDGYEGGYMDVHQLETAKVFLDEWSRVDCRSYSHWLHPIRDVNMLFVVSICVNY